MVAGLLNNAGYNEFGVKANPKPQTIKGRFIDFRFL